MDIKQTIEEMKAALLAFTESFKTQMTFGSIQTTDGKAITFDGEMLVVDGAVRMEDGTPVPDGEYELESNMKITVVGGVVANIEEMEAPAPVEEFATVKQFAEFSEKVTAFEQRFEAMEQSVKTISELMQKQVETMEKFSEQSPAPKAKPINATNDKDEKLKELAAFFNKN
jgi:hypothetical protein